MKSLSSLGIGLSLVFGCLLLALVAELYYLLWWKKRVVNRDIEDDYSSSTREMFYLFCWKKPSSLSSTALNPSVRLTDAHLHESDTQLQLHSSTGKDLVLKPFGEDSVEAELMRLHNLPGPPRFLFTIKEETKEDLESEDGRSRGDRSKKGSRSRSLSDLLLAAETPFMTPLSSPPFFTPPLTPLDRYNQRGYNPLFESSTDGDVNMIRSSPPPKFKFLKDAEEKLYRKTIMEEAMRVHKSGGVFEKDAVKTPIVSNPPMVSDEEDGSFITIIIGKNKGKDQHHHHHQQQHYSTSSQVLPLTTSPSNLRSGNQKPIFH